VTELIPLYVTVCPASVRSADATVGEKYTTGLAMVSTRSVSSLATFIAASSSMQSTFRSPRSSSNVGGVNHAAKYSKSGNDPHAGAQHSDLSTPKWAASLTIELPVVTPLTITITTTTYLSFSACSAICKNSAARPALRARQAGGYITTSIGAGSDGVTHTRIYAGPMYTYRAETASSSVVKTISFESQLLSTSPTSSSVATSHSSAASANATVLRTPGVSRLSSPSITSLVSSTTASISTPSIPASISNSTLGSSSVTIRSSSSFATNSSSATVKSLSMTSATLVATPSVAASACSADPVASLLPVANADLDRTDLANLVPSYAAILNYAQSGTGRSAASIDFEMIYPQITLEDSSYVNKVTCDGDKLSFELAQDGRSFEVIDQWPSSGLVLITNTVSCNNATERGVYMMNKYSLDKTAFKITCTVVRAEWSDVASAMDITYGTSSNSSAFKSSSRCSTTYSATTTFALQPTASAVVDNSSYVELERFIAELKSKAHYNADGSVQLYANNYSAPFKFAANPWQPDNSTLQDQLEAALQAAGLGKPADLANKADNALAGVCSPVFTESSSTSPNARSLGSKRSQPPHGRRDDDDDEDTFDKVVCNDIVSGFLGEYGDVACGIKSMIQHRDTLKCFFTECTGAQSPTYHIYTHDFSGDWKGSLGLPTGTDTVSSSDGNKLTCVNCGLSLSSFKIAGTVRYVFETSALRAATLKISENSKTNMVYHLNTKRRWAYNWNSALDTGDMESVSVAGVFKITPSVIFSMGVDFSTDAAVDVEGGAVLSVKNAQVDFDMSSLTADNPLNWTPRVDMTNPIFKKAAKVKMIPYIRRLIDIKFSVMGKSPNSLRFATTSGLGFNSEMVDASGAVCAIGQLALKSTVFSSNKFTFGDTTQQDSNSMVFSDVSITKPVKCFDVPEDKPTQEEIASLSAIGQSFCTAYNDYYPPVSGLYLVSTVTGPSFTTATETITVTSVPTVTDTISILSTRTRVVQTSAYVLTGSGDQRLATDLLKARDVSIATPTTTPTAHAQKRQMPLIPLVSDWPSSKIKYACSQVATGTDIRTFYTGYSTFYSGVSTVTTTSWVNTDAVAVTKTSTLIDNTWTTSTSAVSSSTIPASCPLQTQVSCFTITGHGPSEIDGKQLGLKDGVLNPSFDYSPSTFYLTCEGNLISLPDTRVLTGPSGANKLSFSNDRTLATACTRDSVTKELTCTQDGSNIIYIWQPSTETSYWDENYFRVVPREDANLWAPAWGPQGNSNNYTALTLSTQDVSCPCAEPTFDQVALVSMDASDISCPASDGTRHTISSRGDWQIQCSTSYNDATLNTVSTASLSACVNACDAVGSCVGATWTSDSQQCALKSSMLSDSYLTGGSAHSFIRLSKTPPPSNTLINNNFIGEDYQTPLLGWSKEGAVKIIDCFTYMTAFQTEICYYPGMYGKSYASIIEGASARYGAVSQTVSLVPGYEYRFSANAGFSNRDKSCLVKYSLDDDVFWSGLPIDTDTDVWKPDAWRMVGPYSVIAVKESQTLKLSLECPNAQDKDGKAWWNDVKFEGPFEVK
jgi:hypothetical protein